MSAARELYDDRSDTCESEMAENGCVSPGRGIGALARHFEDSAAPGLDFGCGTGLPGMLLMLASFETIDGVDLSSELLTQVKSRNVYRSLAPIAPNPPLSHQPGDNVAIAAIAVTGAGADPVAVFCKLMRGLGPGRLFVLSLVDQPLKVPQK